MTPGLMSMMSSEHYLDNDHLHVCDGKGLVISNIAHSHIRSPKCIFTLSNILHVPNIKKPLLSIQKFFLENNVFFFKKNYPLYFMLRISWQMKCFFPAEVEMIYMFCLSPLQRCCLKFSYPSESLLQLMSGIVDLDILVCVFWFF